MISKFRESSYRKDGDKYKVFWKGEEVGEYVGPGKPTQFHNYKYILHSTQKVKLTEVTVRKAIPLEKLLLLEGFSNWCGCGETGMNKHQYIKHIKDYHDGIALPSSILNRPPWVDWVFFYSDEAEILYSRIAPDLT